MENTQEPNDYSYEPIKFTSLTSADLLKEITDPEQTTATAYLVTLSNDTHHFSEYAELLWFPITRRAGIAWGAEDAVWTNAKNVDDAINRYLKDDLIP